VRAVRQVPLAVLKDDFSRYLRLAAREHVVVTRHGQPAGVLIGFASPDDWFEYRLAHDPAFQRRVAEAGVALRPPAARRGRRRAGGRASRRGRARRGAR
jgi:prevent-host-death family protein